MQYSVSTKNIDCCCYHQKFRFLSHFGRLFISVIRFLSLKRTRTNYLYDPRGLLFKLSVPLTQWPFPATSRVIGVDKVSSHEQVFAQISISTVACWPESLLFTGPTTTYDPNLSPRPTSTVSDTFFNHHSIKKTEVGDGGSEVEIGIVGGVIPLNSNCADHMWTTTPPTQTTPFRYLSGLQRTSLLFFYIVAFLIAENLFLESFVHSSVLTKDWTYISV